MRYEALNKEWELSFPFSVRVALEEHFNKGWLGVYKMITPLQFDSDDLKNSDVVMSAMENVREGALLQMLRYGSQSLDNIPMSEAEAGLVYEELGFAQIFPMVHKVIQAANAKPGGAADNLGNAPKAKRPRRKKA